MNIKSVLITGGAGFVGSNLAVLFRRTLPDVEVTALDSLKRRGSELSLPRFGRAGVRFHHGDIRCMEDLEGLPPFDLMIDCSAEPSVQAGLDGPPPHVLATNPGRPVNRLGIARGQGAGV